MTLERTLLDPSTLSPAAQRALAPGPARLMAARGLAPLPRPGDLVTVLYQLGLDSDPAVRDAALATARGLPERVLEGALGDEEVDPRVLDAFADLVLNRPALLHRLLLNRSAADQTMARLAGQVGPAEIDLIAQNEQRLLRHPPIIAAMFQNPKARMSVVDRAIELAARNQIQVPGIPGWEAVAAAALGQSGDAMPAHEADALFADAVDAMTDQDEPAPGDVNLDDVVESAGGDHEDQAAPAPASDKQGKDAKSVPVNRLSIPMKIRLATMGNAFARATLVRDSNKVVAGAAIRAPTVTDIEAAKYAGNHSLSDDVIKYIASRRDWTRHYGIKVALVQNPKMSIPEAMRLMPHLRDRELRTIARSKSVPTAISTQARKLITQRQPQQKKKS